MPAFRTVLFALLIVLVWGAMRSFPLLHSALAGS